MILENVFKEGYTEPYTPVQMVRIFLRGNAGDFGIFRKARDGVKAYLHHNGLAHLAVEIAHVDLTFQPECFAIHPSHPAVEDFETVEDQLVALLNEYIRDDWVYLGILLVRENKAVHEDEEDRKFKQAFEDKKIGGNKNVRGKIEIVKPHPTIVVLVNHFTKHNWLGLSAMMDRILWVQRNNNPRRIRVQIIPGQVRLADSDDDTPSNGTPLHNFVTEAGKFRMGFSIGVKGEKGGGTAGGFVELAHNGVERRGFLTNHHVVAPRDTVRPEDLIEFNKDGSKLDRSDNIEVEMFASADTAATKEYLESMVRDLEKDHGDIKMYHEFDDETETNKYKARAQRIQNCEVDLAKLRVKVEAIRQVALKPVGRVALSSGMLVHEKKIHDWAFVELFSEVADKIYHPNTVPEIDVSHNPANYGSNAKPRKNQIISEFEFMKEGDYYFKQGRWSEITSGICNGAKSHMNWQNREKSRYDLNGNAFEVDPLVTKEWVVWGQRAGDYSMLRQTPVSLPGDFGAFVVDGTGKVCGLLYGTVAGSCGPPAEQTAYTYGGLVMCMSDLMKSLELRAPGAVLSLPSGSSISSDASSAAAANP